MPAFRIVVIGEGMLELSGGGSAEGWHLGQGGDTLNTAIHLARYGFDVSFVSALGRDPFSAALRDAWLKEGLGTEHVLEDPDRLPGLYAIRLDRQAERSFFYWRERSAARHMFALPGIEVALAHASSADLLYLSLITLAILDASAQKRLMDLCRQVRARGGLVAFDGNYRTALWQSPGDARETVQAMTRCCDIGLPTLDDEQALFGSADEDVVLERWRAGGVSEVTLKMGARGCVISDRGARHRLEALAPVTIVDTSGAGDAFNAGYLQARIRGVEPVEAANAGRQLAAWVIGNSGALPEWTNRKLGNWPYCRSYQND